MSESPLASLQRAAEAVRQQLHLNTFDAYAVQRLADFIETLRLIIKPAEQEGVVTALGCFLGQCLIQAYRGEWATGADSTTGVGINGNTFFNPFHHVAQQFAHGLPESVVTSFERIPERLQAASGRKNWI